MAETTLTPTHDEVRQALDQLQRALKGVAARELESGHLRLAEAVIKLLRQAEEFGRQVDSTLNEQPVAGERRQFLTDAASDGSRDHYPRFVRRGDTVVKVGLKRNKRDLYEQKMGSSEWAEIGAVLVELAQRGGTFEAQDVISRVEAPSYLAYLLLGVLQEHELVTSPRRGEYRFASTFTNHELNDLWDRIPRDEG